MFFFTYSDVSKDHTGFSHVDCVSLCTVPCKKLGILLSQAFFRLWPYLLLKPGRFMRTALHAEINSEDRIQCGMWQQVAWAGLDASFSEREAMHMHRWKHILLPIVSR